MQRPLPDAAVPPMRKRLGLYVVDEGLFCSYTCAALYSLWLVGLGLFGWMT